MILYPAIDLLDGRVVRLAHGDFGAVTDYGGDPGAVARAYADDGADWIHLVDLSGARDGVRRQTASVAAVAACRARVQTGGGVRARDDVSALLDAGASRVVVGSLAVTEPEIVAGWIADFGADRIVCAFDVRLEGDVVRPLTRGWTRDGREDLDTLLDRYTGSGLVHALATDVGRDGALTGPNTDLYTALIAAWPAIQWQASGGVAGLDDLAALKTAGAAGAIVGKALFEGRFSLKEALACSRNG